MFGANELIEVGITEIVTSECLDLHYQNMFILLIGINQKKVRTIIFQSNLRIEYLVYVDNLSANSADEDNVENEPVRLSRSNGKDAHQHSMIRSASLYSQFRQPSNGSRSMNNVSFMSDTSRNGAESNAAYITEPFKKG